MVPVVSVLALASKTTGTPVVAAASGASAATCPACAGRNATAYMPKEAAIVAVTASVERPITLTLLEEMLAT